MDALLESGKPVENKTSQNEAIFKFIQARFELITRTFVVSLSECNSAAKVPRLKCLQGLISYITKVEQRTLVRQIMPEVILCIKEVNQKSRDASFTLLSSMLKIWQKLGLESSPAVNETGIY